MSGHLNSKRPILYMLLEDQKGESVQEENAFKHAGIQPHDLFANFLSLFTEAA